jgi:hypothetical protein
MKRSLAALEEERLEYARSAEEVERRRDPHCLATGRKVFDQLRTLTAVRVCDGPTRLAQRDPPSSSSSDWSRHDPTKPANIDRG